MTTALTRLSGSAFVLTLTVPWTEVKAIYDKVFDELASQIEVEGFRKGKAPKKMVDAKLDKKSVYDEVIKRLLPDAYAKALEEHHLKPIINPRIEIAEGTEEKDWQFIAKAAEKPSVELKDYKEQISAINAKNKIWTPDQGELNTAKEEEKDKDDKKSEQLNKIIEKLLEVCQVEIPELLIESEVNRLMTELIDDVRAAGMTYEQYLGTKNVTAEQLRDNYRQQVVTTLKLEFILEAISDDLNIAVEPAEIAAVIEKETDENRKKNLNEQTYYLTSVLRRQKTLTKLATL